MKKICIVEAKRTPQGRFLGGLSTLSSIELGLAAGKAVLGQVKPEDIDQVILGNCSTPGQSCIARQISVMLGIPQEVPSFVVNMNCASGLQSIILACNAILLNEARVVLCGGTESMSQYPYMLSRARTGYKIGHSELTDSLISGLVDPVIGEIMGITAERIAERYKISRVAQDEFALRSHRKYFEANAKGKFKDELIAVGKCEQDEHPRIDTSMEKLATLKPTFKEGGTITPGNSSGINDGAAMLVICDETVAKERNWKVLAVIHSWAAAGCDPKVMGLGPIYSTKKLCQQQQLKIDDFDTIEINEAFSAQAIGCAQELGVKESRLNLDGGAIALGHPVGASGSRLITHLAHRIARGETKMGLATLCVGGGMGVSMAVKSA